MHHIKRAVVSPCRPQIPETEVLGSINVCGIKNTWYLKKQQLLREK
jgi:hypothetical protein